MGTNGGRLPHGPYLALRAGVDVVTKPETHPIDGEPIKPVGYSLLARGIVSHLADPPSVGALLIAAAEMDLDLTDLLSEGQIQALESGEQGEAEYDEAVQSLYDELEEREERDG